jgi:hypothetical protein
MVPREYVGLARQFLRDCEAEHTIAADMFKQISKPVFDRLIRYPQRKLRDGDLRNFARQWKTTPDRFRLIFQTRLDVRGCAGRIAEVRLQTAKLSFPEWNESVEEPSITITMHCLKVPLKGRNPAISRCVATISLHALARRFQRGKDKSHEAICEDFLALFLANIADYETFPTDENFSIPTADGAWLGLTCEVDTEDQKSHRQFVVRTFMDNDA